MRKYANLIFIAIVVVVVAFFAYSKLQGKVEETKKANLIKAVSQSSKAVNNTAEDKSLTANDVTSFVVGKDIKAGYYDISTDSDCDVFIGFVIVNKNNPAINIPLSDGDKVNFNAAGSATFTKSGLKALQVVNYEGKEVYQVPSQGLYFVGNQLEAGKYKLLYQNLPKVTKSTLPADTIDISLYKTGLDYGKLSSLGVTNVNRSADKQLEPTITVDKKEILGIAYQNPPKDLKVYLEKIGQD